MTQRIKYRASRKDRIPKTLDEKLSALDAHLFALRRDLYGLREDPTRLKTISAELRTLVCSSSNMEGLLWRLVDELEIDDSIFLHVAFKQKWDDLPASLPVPLPTFAIVPIQRGGKGDPRLPPNHYSLKRIIKESDALVVKSTPLSHEYLILAISQQMGSAHEDDGLEPALVDLKSILIGGKEPFVPILATDAELTLEIGERILEYAGRELGFERQHHENNYGNVSIAIRLRIKRLLAGRILLVVFRSYISSIDIVCTAGPTGVTFAIKKNGRSVGEHLSEYPCDWEIGDDMVFVFSYCSRTSQARTITNGEPHEIVSLDLGWLHTVDLQLEQNNREHMDFIEKQFLLTFQELLSSKHSEGIRELPPDLHGMWKDRAEIDGQGVFPD